MNRSGCIGIRLAIAFAVGTIALLVFGGNGIMNGIKYRAPVTMTFDEFVKQKPSAGWFHITGGVLDVVDEGHIVDKDKPADAALSGLRRAYVPVHSAKTYPDGPDSDATHLLLFTNDAAVMDTIRDMASRVSDSTPKDQLVAYLAANKDRLLVKRDIDGMVKSGLGAESSENRKLLEPLFHGLDSDYVILDEGARPSLGTGIGLFALGLLLGVGQVLFYLRARMSR